MAEAYRDGFWFRKAVLEGCFTIPGDGCVDFLVEAEQDPARANPFKYACKARDYIRKTAEI